jgi:hypothetical protein
MSKCCQTALVCSGLAGDELSPHGGRTRTAASLWPFSHGRDGLQYAAAMRSRASRSSQPIGGTSPSAQFTRWKAPRAGALHALDLPHGGAITDEGDGPIADALGDDPSGLLDISHSTLTRPSGGCARAW